MDKETRSIGPGKWCCVLLGVILIITTIGPGVCAQEQEQRGWTGNINVFIGQKWLEEDDWEPLEEQFEFGIQIDARPVTWPVSIAVDWSYSMDEETVYDPWLGSVDLEGRTMEIDLGIRYIYEKLPYVRPFIGGGPALVWADAEGSALGITVSEDDWGIGFWIGGGAYVTLAEHFNLGIQAKYSWAEVDLYGIEAEAGGWHLGGLVGYHW